MTKIRLAETESELVRCYPVVRQLRPHLNEAQFLESVNRHDLDANIDR